MFFHFWIDFSESQLLSLHSSHLSSCYWFSQASFSVRPCLFLGIHFPGNHFPNFPVFVCHEESWSTKNTFWSTENTFQSTETFSGKRKTFSSQRKIWFGFQESVFPFSCVCFPESDFRETTFQTFMCLFAIKKVDQRKTLFSQRKI